MHKQTVFLRLCFALIITVGLSMAFARSSQGQDGGWSDPVPLTDELQNGDFPEIVADGSGRVHAFWSSSAGDYDLVLYRYQDPGKSWSEVRDIQALFSAGGRRIIPRPVVISGPDGRLHMLFRSNTMFYSAVPAYAAADARAWSKPESVKVDEGNNYFGQLAFDSAGTMHLVFTENVPTASCAECLRLFYRASKDDGKTWSEPIKVTDLIEGMAKPGLVVDEDDNLHLVWESGRGGDLGATDVGSRIRYAALLKGSETWTPSISFSTPDLPTGKNPVLAIDKTGQLIVTWLATDKDAFYYNLSDDGGRTWSEAEQIPGLSGGWTIYQARTDGASVAADSTGTLHFAMIGRLPAEITGLSVMHLAWDGAEWSDPDPIITLQGDAPEWPSITVSLGNTLHVIWFVRDEEHIWISDAGNYKVWTAFREIEAPGIRPDAYPAQVTPTLDSSTSNATPKATPLPTLMPTPTLDPALQISPTPAGGNPVGIGVPVYQESEYLVLLVKTLVPSVLLLGLVIGAVVVYRRRL